MAFVVFEGGEGVGKSTQIKLLAKALRQKGVSFIETREPGGTPLAEEIRALFKAVPQHHDEPTPLTELYLVMAARAQHIEKTILPRLASGNWVLCDRFLDSSFVYQGIRGGVSFDIIRSLAAPIVKTCVPDLTFVFTVPTQVGCARIMERDQPGTDRLDGCAAEIHTLIHGGFEKMAKESVAWHNSIVPKRVIIDGTASIEAIFSQIREHLLKILGVDL